MNSRRHLFRQIPSRYCKKRGKSMPSIPPFELCMQRPKARALLLFSSPLSPLRWVDPSVQKVQSFSPSPPRCHISCPSPAPSDNDLASCVCVLHSTLLALPPRDAVIISLFTSAAAAASLLTTGRERRGSKKWKRRRGSPISRGRERRNTIKRPLYWRTRKTKALFSFATPL